MPTVNRSKCITNPMYGITRRKQYRTALSGWQIRLNHKRKSEKSVKFQAFVSDYRADGDPHKSLEMAKKIRDEKLRDFLERGIIQNRCAPQKSTIVDGLEVSSLYLLNRNHAQEGLKRFVWAVWYKDKKLLKQRCKSFSVLKYGDPFMAFVAALKFKRKMEFVSFGQTRIKEYKVLDYFIQVTKSYETKHGKTGFLDHIHGDLLKDL
jgi:hypothetical protein